MFLKNKSWGGNNYATNMMFRHFPSGMRKWKNWFMGDEAVIKTNLNILFHSAGLWFSRGDFKNYVIAFLKIDFSFFHRNLIFNAKLKVSPFPPPLRIFLVLAKRGILTQFINFYCFEKYFLPFRRLMDTLWEIFR